MFYHIGDDLTHFMSRSRTPTLDHIKEDLELLEKGILDPHSFKVAYTPVSHPVEVRVHNALGELKHVRYSHNLRTNKGGHDQGLNMSSTTPVATAQYIGLSNSSVLAPNASDTTLLGEVASANLARTLATFSWISDPSASQPSTVQGSYKLVASWTATAPVSGVRACGVFNVGGDLWFEAIFGSIDISTGDSVALSYTINF